MFQWRIILHTLIVFFVLVALFFIFTATTKPWEKSGRLVLVVYAIPVLDDTDILFDLGIDDIELYTTNNSTKKVKARVRRFTLNPKNNSLEILVDTNVPATTYSGFSFSLQSPELKNNLESDTAPTPVSLIEEKITINNTSFHVEKDTTSSIILGFETTQAIQDNEGKKVYLPVLHLETRSNTSVVTQENGTNVVQSGVIEGNATYGMNWNGIMRFNYRARSKQEEMMQMEQEDMPYEPTIETIETVEKTTDTSTTTEENVTEIPNNENDTLNPTSTTQTTEDLKEE